jgi:phosphoribosylamine--glycine ligase
LATGKKVKKKRKDAVKVGIVMGSDSDLDIMQEAAEVLKDFQIPYELTVASAHRSPKRAGNFAAAALKRGMKVKCHVMYDYHHPNPDVPPGQVR